MTIHTMNRHLPAAISLIALTIALPGLAQTTVLTGSVNRQYTQTNLSGSSSTKRNIPALRSQQARYDKPSIVRVQPAHKYYVKDNRTYWQRHPVVKGAAIGAGTGAVVGGITGLIARKGFVRGAAIGAGAGAGIGVVRTSKTMKRHPIIRDLATGTLAGGGLGWAASRNGSTVGKSAAVGGALGLGVGLFKNLR